jgi:hypothetical protein
MASSTIATDENINFELKLFQRCRRWRILTVIQSLICPRKENQYAVVSRLENFNMQFIRKDVVQDVILMGILVDTVWAIEARI